MTTFHDLNLASESRQSDRLLAASEIAGMVSFAFEADTGRLDHSPGLATLFGTTSCSTIGDLIAVTHVEDQRAMEVFFCLLRSAPRDEPDEIDVRDSDGDHVINFRACLKRGTNDRSLVLGVLQDVTKHRQREDYLVTELQRLADAQTVARIGTWEWVPETSLLELSDITCAITGREPGAAVSYDEYLSRVLPEDREYVKHIWRELRHSPHSEFTCEHRYRCPNGRTRVLRIHGAQVGKVRADGRRRLLGTLQDVTEQRAVATRLQRFTALCQVAPLGMGVFDGATRLVEANSALCGLLGYSLEQLRELDAADLTHPSYPSTLIPEPDDEIAAYDSTVSECTLTTRNGHPVHCELHRGLTAHEDGSCYWLLVFFDITERVRQTDTLRHQATHDYLTGLPNRAAVKEILATFGRDSNTQRALLFCDIDNFKMINDILGHDTGDEVLRDLARRLRMYLPASCTPARLAGDEFLVLCSDVDAVGGLDKLTDTVSSLMRTSITRGDTEFPVSASVGVGTTDFTTDGEELLHMADAAMIRHKLQHKNSQQ